MPVHLDEARDDGEAGRIDHTAGVVLRPVGFDHDNAMALDDDVDVLPQLGRSSIEQRAGMDHSAAARKIAAPGEIDRDVLNATLVQRL